jgi:hypothetical protein
VIVMTAYVVPFLATLAVLSCIGAIGPPAYPPVR